MDNSNIAILVLAAGSGSRFGAAKQLAKLHDRPVLQWVLDCAISSGHPVYCVLGAHREQILSSEELNTKSCQIVVAEDWKSGLSCSIHAGLAQIVEDIAAVDAVLIMLGDQPLVTPADLFALTSAFEQSPGKVVASRYEDALGVPAIFPRESIGRLSELEGDRGAQLLITRLPHTWVQTPNRMVDIDCLEDLQCCERLLEP